MYFYMHHVCGHGGHMEVRGQAAVISSSLYHVGLRNWILVMRLGGKHLSTELSHYPNSTFQMYYSETSLKYCECFAAYFMLGKNPGSFFFFLIYSCSLFSPNCRLCLGTYVASQTVKETTSHGYDFIFRGEGEDLSDCYGERIATSIKTGPWGKKVSFQEQVIRAKLKLKSFCRGLMEGRLFFNYHCSIEMYAHMYVQIQPAVSI